MSNWHLTTPVALFVFNRPLETKRVFEAVALQQPPVLLVIADGARADRPEERELCNQTREIIDLVTWECDLRLNFSDENLGCKRRVSSGIDWVFEQVEEAIILEDDCLPSAAFFRFAEEMLKRYRHDRRIGMISGDNFQNQRTGIEADYYFSKYGHIWGWASWSRAWNNYDVSISSWPELKKSGFLRSIHQDQTEVSYWTAIFDAVHRGDIDTWDYQWVLTLWTQSQLTVLPEVNMISNIGFGEEATHTVAANSPYANLEISDLDFPLAHPEEVVVNRQADTYTWETMYAPRRENWYLKPIRYAYRALVRMFSR